MLLLCALTLALPGCANLAAGTQERMRPAPLTPGAIITDDFVCIPHAEAAELLLWIEEMEKVK